KKSVAEDWLDGGCAEWGVHAVEELEEQDADPEAVRGQAVGLRLRHFDDEVLSAQFGQVVAQLTQAVRVGSQAEGVGNDRGAMPSPSAPSPGTTLAVRDARELSDSTRPTRSVRSVRGRRWQPPEGLSPD